MVIMTSDIKPNVTTIMAEILLCRNVQMLEKTAFKAITTRGEVDWKTSPLLQFTTS